MIKVAPSILAANFNNLYDEVKSVECADYLHIDVMDVILFKLLKTLSLGLSGVPEIFALTRSARIFLSSFLLIFFIITLTSTSYHS